MKLNRDKRYSKYPIHLVIVFIFSVYLPGCPDQDSVEDESEMVIQPDLSKLPATIRNRLKEAEERLPILEKQRHVFKEQIEQLERLEATYEAKESDSARLSQIQDRLVDAHAQFDALDRHLVQLKGLVQKIKLQAYTDEVNLEAESDEQLTKSLKQTAEVLDEMAELSTLEKEAKEGKAQAQFLLGQRYEKGNGVEESDFTALGLYEKAAKQGHERAALAAGFFYRHGRGTQVNLQKAISFYRKAADLGNPIAANNLGRIHHNKLYAVTNNLKNSANQKNDTLSNKSTDKASRTLNQSNLKKAKYWFAIAAQSGMKSAQLSLAKLYLLEASLWEEQQEKELSKLKKARKLLNKARQTKNRKVREEAQLLIKKLEQTLKPKLTQKTLEEIHWIMLSAGKMKIGESNQYTDSKPQKQLTLASFEMTATEITVSQYQSCINVGHCSAPKLKKKKCHHKMTENSDLPMNCVSWAQAREFAQWLGGDLPSEAQWEYAARSQGKYKNYPWGIGPSNCLKAIMWDDLPNKKVKNNKKRSKKNQGCGKGKASKVCSKPDGMSEQGLCDMIGNLWEWTLDEYRPSYEPLPLDGKPVCGDEDCLPKPHIKRVIRGGAYMTKSSGANSIIRSKSDRAAVGIGFRVIRPLKVKPAANK